MILLILSLSQGDWRLLHLLAHNMNPIVFAEFVIELELQVVSLELNLKVFPQADKGSEALTRFATKNNNESLRKPLLTSLQT